MFGSFGNDIFDVQKEFYVFREFSTNVPKDLLTEFVDAGEPEREVPAAGRERHYSHAISSYYVEDGSYVQAAQSAARLHVPPSMSRDGCQATRVYVQAENLFTITGYDGLDPALPAANVTGPAGDIRDQYRGVDRGRIRATGRSASALSTSF